MNAVSYLGILLNVGWLGFAPDAVLAGREQAPQPRILRIAYAQDAKTLDPALVIEADNYELLYLLFTTLLDSSQGTKVIDSGVQSWSASPDWRVFTFHLRPELRFSNGRRVVAADYAYAFLERNVRLGMAALDKDYTLQQSQREQARQVRQRAQAMLLQISQEKNLLYQKVGSFRAVATHLEQLERQLRSSMPQHVMDMLGQQAAYMTR